MKPILCPACGNLQREPSGAELRALRDAAGATQDAVARALGVNRSYVSLVEGARRGASLRLIRYYLKTFGKSTDPEAPKIEDVYPGSSAEDHLRRVVRHLVKGRRKRNPPPAWLALERPFGTGSTSAARLCVWAGLHPDSGKDL